MGDVETDSCGLSDFPVTLERRDEYDTCPGLLRGTPSNDELQVRSRVPQDSQYARKPTGFVWYGRCPNIYMLDEKIHDESSYFLRLVSAQADRAFCVVYHFCEAFQVRDGHCCQYSQDSKRVLRLH
jgi:hypothetical protein